MHNDTLQTKDTSTCTMWASETSIVESNPRHNENNQSFSEKEGLELLKSHPGRWESCVIILSAEAVAAVLKNMVSQCASRRLSKAVRIVRIL
jgi:hypothetical protein